MWCKYCSKDRRTQRDGAFICCNDCGRILEQDDFTDEPTFSKGAGGESRMNGVFVRSVQNDHRESFERTLEKGKQLINGLMTKFQSNEGQLHSQASNFYRLALEKGFTRGRKTEQVAGACLYLACRASNKPYLLIDFAIWLGVNVYVLGAVYLQLCKLMSLQEHDFVQKLVDPSIFMHRFTNGLMKDNKSDKDHKRVLKTALLIVASMKRDWMQTGRKPSGICGAALYIAALSHGQSYSKTDIIKHVHICEATLTKRLIEFENTPSGSLTIEEFTQHAEEFEREKRSVDMSDVNTESDKVEVLCKHNGSEPHFAHGLCKSCYEDFLEISGGLIGGSEPPSFQVAEMNRSDEKEGCPDNVNDEINDGVCNTKKDALPEAESVLGNHGSLDRECNDSTLKDGDIPSVADETENLSDIDDKEVNCYLASEEESRLKKIIWEEVNKEYLQEQAAKEAAIAAYMKDIGDAPADVLDARKFAAAAAAAVDKKREQRRLKRALEAKNAGTPQTAAEATRQMLTKKGFSSKINYECLDKLFDEDLPLSAKKADAQPLDDNTTPSKKPRKEEKENGAKERKPKDQAEKEENIEDEAGEEVYEDTTYDQSEYYYEEDNFFDDGY